MTLFWTLIAGLILLAIFVILWPLLPFNIKKLSAARLGQSSKNVEIFRQRLTELEEEQSQGKWSTEEFDRMKLELEQTVLDEFVEENFQAQALTVSGTHWLSVGVLSIVLICVSLGLYHSFGRSSDLASYLVQGGAAANRASAKPAQNPAASRMNLAEAVVSLEEKLAASPNDKKGWNLLAMTYRQLGSFRKSAEAFKHLISLLDQDDPRYAATLGSYAQTLYIAEDETMTEEIKQLMQQALQIDPQEPGVLSLAGAEAFAQNDFKTALQHWEQALKKADPVQTKQYLRPAIVVARARLGLPDAVPAATAAEATSDKPGNTAAATTTQPGITVRVSLTPELQSQTRPDQTVFIFARPVGGRMPAAATRLQVKDLPAEVRLDDSLSPMPTAKLSSFEKVEITARISRSGQPMAQSGDLFVTRSPVAVKNQSETLELSIQQIVP